MDSSSKHIALFLPSLGGGGAERVFVSLAQGFIDSGHTVDLLAVQASGPFLRELPPKVNLIDLDSGRIVYSLPKVLRFLKNRSPDIFLSTLNHVNVFSIILKLLAKNKTKFFIREANTFSHNHNKLNGIKKILLPWLVKALYPFADGVIAVSNGVKMDLERYCKFSDKKITTINNPVVVKEFLKETDSAFNITFSDDKTPVILGVGSLSKQKDFCTLVKAFNIVRKHRKCRLVILGEGTERALLESLIEEMGLESIVDLPGFKNDPFSYMKKSAVFVLSSLWEGFPNVLVQAMACGCPVVSTDCPSGPAEILKNGEYGELVPVGDVETLARKIDFVLNSPPDRQRLIERTREFSLEKITKEYLRFFDGNA